MRTSLLVLAAVGVFAGTPASADPLASYAWQRVALEYSPPYMGAALAVDGGRATAYLFGGAEQGNPFVDRLYQGDLRRPALNWERISQDAGPSPRRFAHAFFDRAADRLIILGGRDETDATLSDTWAWDRATGQWSTLAPSVPSPGGIEQEDGFTYDGRRNRLLWFDGSGPSVRTWALSLDAGPAWTELATTFPPEVLGSTSVAAYDSLGDRVFFIGEGTRALWALDLSTLAWSEAIGAAANPILFSTRLSLFWDGADHRLVCFAAVDPQTTVNLATVDLEVAPLAWQSDQADGTDPLTFPRPWVYDPVARELLLESNATGNSPQLFRMATSPVDGSFDWRIHASDGRPRVDLPVAQAADVRNRWWYLREGRTLHRVHLDDLGRFEKAHPEGEGPTPRSGQGAVWDSTLSRILFCGGTDSTGAAVGDVWELALSDPPRWRLLSTSALPIGSSVALDPVRQLLYATLRISGVNQLWALDLAVQGASWTSLLSGLPIAPDYLAYDAPLNRLLGVRPMDGVSIDLNAAPPRSSPLALRAVDTVYGSAATFDSHRGQMLVHNGMGVITNSGASVLFRTDAFGAQGSASFADPEVTGESSTPQAWSNIVYDPARDRVVLLNGRQSYYPFIVGPVNSVIGLWTLQFDPGVPTRLDLVDVVPVPDGAGALRVRFSGDGPAGEVRVERTVDGLDAWLDLGLATETVPGLYEFTDAHLERGVAHRYRGRWFADGVWNTTKPSERVTLPVSGPAAGLALRARAGSIVRAWPAVFECTLAGAEPGALELVDVTGRVLARRTIVVDGAVEFSPGREVGAGLYFARLRQGSRAVTVRVVRL